MPKRYPTMAFEPDEWVKNQIHEFGSNPCVIDDMLLAMRGSMVPDTWIDEALKHNGLLIQ